MKIFSKRIRRGVVPYGRVLELKFRAVRNLFWETKPGRWKQKRARAYNGRTHAHTHERAFRRTRSKNVIGRKNNEQLGPRPR